MALATRPRRGPSGVVPPELELRRAFDAHERALTLGVEEELMVLDPETLDLAARGPELVGWAGHPAVRAELPAAQVEVVTPVCRDAGHVLRALRAGRRRLLAAADGRVRLAGSGTHPFADAEGAMVPGGRYDRLAHEYQWAARRSLMWGVHVHVAVPGADRALAVHDALRSWLPLIAALAGNAPFHEGRDTGLHSVRPKIAEGFPRQGVPPAWGSWSAYADFLVWNSPTGTPPAVAAADLWWEVRLHPVHGTVEVRVCDQAATARASAALAALVQALCGTLAARYDVGELAPPAPRERIEENRWRALRHGVDGTMLDLDAGGERPTHDLVVEMLDAVAPMATVCGSAAQLDHAWDLLARTGSAQQRDRATVDGVRGIVAGLADAFEDEIAPAR